MTLKAKAKVLKLVNSLLKVVSYPISLSILSSEPVMVSDSTDSTSFSLVMAPWGWASVVGLDIVTNR